VVLVKMSQSGRDNRSDGDHNDGAVVDERNGDRGGDGDDV